MLPEAAVSLAPSQPLGTVPGSPLAREAPTYAGTVSIQQQVTEALLIFVIPPSQEELFERLQSRATETADQLERRQRDAAIELGRQGDYDHVVTNETGQVERTAARIDGIIADEHELHPDRRVRV